MSTRGYMTMWKFQHIDTLPSGNIKIWTNEQVKIAARRYKTKCEYQHSDTWPSKNINMRINEKVSISTWGHMYKWKEQHCSMWTIENINISYMMKCEHQHGDTSPRENGNMGLYDQVWISTQNT